MAEASLSPEERVINIARLSSHNCTYCGSIYGVCRDHVIPTSYLREKRKYEGDWLVPSCAECNVTLGAELIFNVPDRAAWIRAAYRQKYRKLLRNVRWDEDELVGLGYSLRRYIEGAAAERLIVEARMKRLTQIAAMPITYLANLRPAIDPEIEDVPEFVDDDFWSAKLRRLRLLQRARKLKRISEENLST